MKKEHHHPIEIQVSYHPELSIECNPKIRTSQDAFSYIIKHWNLDTLSYKEELKILFLNRANMILGYHSMAIGGITTCSVDIRVLFGMALKCGATGIIMVHNHPSQSFDPSDEDLRITEKVQECGKLFEITLFDHIIICAKDAYLSMSDEGLIYS